MAVSEAHKRGNRKWDAANMKVASCKLTKAEHAAFKAYAEAHGKTISGMLLDYIRSCISTEQPEDSQGTTEQRKYRRATFHFRGADYLGFPALLEQLRAVGYDGSPSLVQNYLYKGRIGPKSLRKYPMIAEISTKHKSTEQSEDSQGTTEQKSRTE